MWMIPTFVGVVAACALASMVMPRASAGNEINVFFKVQLLKFETTIERFLCWSERTADGKAERRPLFIERIGLAERCQRAHERLLVWKRRPVGYDRRL